MSYLPSVSVSGAAAAVNMSSAANMAAAAYFKNGTYGGTHMTGAALSFTPPAHNFLPASMGYISGTLADCQSASMTAWGTGQASRWFLLLWFCGNFFKNIFADRSIKKIYPMITSAKEMI